MVTRFVCKHHVNLIWLAVFVIFMLLGYLPLSNKSELKLTIYIKITFNLINRSFCYFHTQISVSHGQIFWNYCKKKFKTTINKSSSSLAFKPFYGSRCMSLFTQAESRGIHARRKHFSIFLICVSLTFKIYFYVFFIFCM